MARAEKFTASAYDAVVEIGAKEIVISGGTQKIIGPDGTEWGPKLAAVTAALKAVQQPIAAYSEGELDAFLKNKPEPGALAPTGEVFVDWRKNGEALLMFGILPKMSQWLADDDALNALMLKQGIDLLGRRYVRPSEEDGALINSHQTKGELKQRLAKSKFEDGDRSFWLSASYGDSTARVQDLGDGRQDPSTRGSHFSSCAVRGCTPSP